jgi:hypothetical protein
MKKRFWYLGEVMIEREGLNVKDKSDPTSVVGWLLRESITPPFEKFRILAD